MKKITFIIICLLSVAFASAQLNSVSIVGNGAGGWPGEAGNPGPQDTNQMTTSDDGVTWTIENLTLSEGAVKFRGNNSWDLPYNWGGATFPSGRGIEDGDAITSTAGVYNVTFNANTLVYDFTLITETNLTSVSIVGSGAGGWPGEAGNPGPEDKNQMTTSDDGVTWTIENLTLSEGAVKFRGNNSWDLPYNWGGSTFPSDTAIEDGDAITSIAGIYDVSFNSNTLEYSFISTTLGFESTSLTSFELYPNPTSDIVNIKFNKDIASLIVFDLMGRKVLETQNVINKKISIGEFQSGTYLFNIKDFEGKTIVKKVILE
tara:strand:+ start:18551 stop:19501 length:951 start_codon:yes stop_codon:yes gene_type:complete